MLFKIIAILGSAVTALEEELRFRTAVCGGSGGNRGSSPGQGTFPAHPRDRENFGHISGFPKGVHPRVFQVGSSPVQRTFWVYARVKGHSRSIPGSGDTMGPSPVSQLGPSLVQGAFRLLSRVRGHWGSIPGSGDTMHPPSGQGTTWNHPRVRGHSGPIPGFPRWVHPW